MRISHKFCKLRNTPNSEAKKTKLHPRVVNSNTVNTDKLARLIEHASSPIEGDAKAALNEFCRILTSELQAGDRVHLDGLGYFYLTLAAPPIESDKEICAESVKVKSIAFLPEAALKKQFKIVTIRRVKRKNHSQSLSETELDEILADYFKEHTSITRRSFQELCGLTKSTATRRIKKLLEEGKLKISRQHLHLYEWIPEK